MQRSSLALFTTCLLVWPGAWAATPVLRVVNTAPSAESLLRNGDFEQTRGVRLADWTAAPKGFGVASGEGRRGSQALRCENASEDGWLGASQSVTLNRTNTAPLIVRGWSKAQDVSGGSDSGYSLYVDLVYSDGTPLWGQTGNFHCGTHDWEQREFVILPDKPVKSLTLNCLFRGHRGKVWFDDVSVAEVRTENGALLFQGVPVQRAEISHLNSPISERSLNTRDDLKLTLRDHAVVSLQVRGQEFAEQSPAGFLVRDAAANSDVFDFEKGACPELGLKLQTEFLASSNHLAIQGRISDITGKDRAVTLVFALPVDATAWHWGDDIRRNRVVNGSGEFANQVGVRCGATGTMSLYPLAALWNDRTGLALALDMAQPAQFRLGYHAGLKLLFIAYDFGLVKETERFPSSAEFRFVVYRFDPVGGFRAAWQKYLEIFPDYFVVRSKEQGLWMPFTEVSKVQGWEDFGFRFHEGNNSVAWDDAHGVLSFRYTEPMTWWMAMKQESPRMLSEALRVREELAQSPNESSRRLAEVSRTAAMCDETGQPALLFRNEPWCNGAVWSLNPNPWLGVTVSAASPAASTPLANRQSPIANALNAATVHWNAALKEKLYGPDAKGTLDGEYLDSLEGYVTADLNFAREHFRCTTVPLSFTSDTKRPALFKGLAVFEFTKWFCDDVHRLGKLTFANGVPYRFTFLCPWLDVLGTETDWLRDGKYTPASDTTMNLWRTMSGAKPYLLLMNTDYDRFTPELVEKYFRRSLFYGMWPGFFSHNAADNPYWQNPKWYNRDRPLFKKYLPLVKRVSEAGWQPVTEARCDNDRIFVERFGPDAGGAVYFTLFNDTAQAQSGNFAVNPALVRPDKAEVAREWVSEAAITATPTGFPIRLLPQAVALIEFRR